MQTGRFVIGRENDETFPGTFLAPGCLSVGADALPVVCDFLGSELFGQARGFERDPATGICTMEIDTNAPADLKLEDENFAFYATDLVEYNTTDTRIILKAVIRQITFVPLPGYPRR